MIIITGTLDEDPYKFMIVSRSVLLSVKTVSDKSCRKNQNTSFMFNMFFFFNHAACYIVLKNTVDPDRPQTAAKHGARTLHAGYVTLQAHTQNMWYLYLIHVNNGYANAPHFYVVHTFPVLLYLEFTATSNMINLFHIFYTLASTITLSLVHLTLIVMVPPCV
jgi:hypothetical protein